MEAAARADGQTTAERELRDVREQFAATREILSPSVGRGRTRTPCWTRSSSERAALCHADAAQLYLVRGDRFGLSRISGPTPQGFLDYVREHPVMVSRSSLVGRVALDRRTQQIPDVLADPEYGRLDLQRLGGLPHAARGADDARRRGRRRPLAVAHRGRRPSTSGRPRLLEAFAAQAAIALSNVAAARARWSPGPRSSPRRSTQLEALREVGDAVSSSLDLDEVLQTIVTHAVRLTGTRRRLDHGVRRGGRRLLGARRLREQRRAARRVCAASRSTRDSTLVGRAALDGTRSSVATSRGAARPAPADPARATAGARCSPCRCCAGTRWSGALVIRRRTPGDFAAETFGAARDFAEPVGARHPQRPAVPRARDAARAELEVASRHKSEFLASMSHELRTPLNAVIGFSEVLLEQMFGELNERQDEYLRDILSSGRHLLELLNDILDLSKVEAGQDGARAHAVPVPDALEYACVGPRAGRRTTASSSTLERRRRASEPIDADELRFKQVLVNLLSNAVKFTPDGGAVDAWPPRRAGASSP